MQYVNELKKLEIEDIRNAAKNANIKRIYLHWSAGHYHQVYEDYHLSIDEDGSVYAPDNDLNFNKLRYHTWHRNTGSIGISVCGCYGANALEGWNCNLGDEGVTNKQIETMAFVVAVICKYANVPIYDVLTHCEIAMYDGYGPGSGDSETRWDLWYLRDTDGKMKPGGQVIRGKALWYTNNYVM